jgi:tetratricopeptide (TPR) repeat protein
MSRKSRARRRQGLATPPLSAPGRGTPEPGARTQAPRWVHALAPGLIALVTFAAFLPTLESQFVNWDDDKNLVDNPHYRGLGWPQLRWMWTTFHIGHYIPLTWMTLGLDYLLWGMQPRGYHLINLVLHAVNAVVFYFVGRRILGLALPGAGHPDHLRLASAAFAALLFALHPLRVESVAWATERRDVLSGLFYLLTLLAYLRACQREERGRWWYAGCVALFICALLSKSMAVSLPVVLLILDVYPLRRFGGARGWWGEAARRVYLEKIPFVLLAGAASVLAFLALARLNNMAPLDQLSVLERLAVSTYGLGFYLWKTVAPFNLSPLYVLPANLNLWAASFLLSYGVVLAFTILAWTLRHRVPGLAAAWLAYVVTLLPVLGVFQNGPQIAADRYTYLAGLGWAIWAGGGLLSCWPRLPSLVTGAAVCVLLGSGVLTWKQVHVWHDSERLWTHVLAIEPNSPLAEYNLAYALARQGRPAEAIEHYRQAVKLRPDDAEAHYNWGNALVRLGKPAEAIEHYRQALSIRPGYAEAHYNWGVMLAQQGRLGEAIEHYRQALELRPDDADVLNHWGDALARQGRPAEAIEHYQRALGIKPYFAEAHMNFGMALAQQGKPAEAIERYQQALTIRPDFADAHYNWGHALTQQGKPAEAIGHYREALRIQPGYAEAHYNWGVQLAQQGKSAEAIEQYRQALTIRPDFAEAHYNWGNTLLKLGKPTEAVEHYRQALAIRPDFAEAHYNWGAALAQQGNQVGAMEHFQRALSIRTNTTSNP